MTEVFHVQRRSERGTRRMRRMRSAGQIPAVLYGHQKENVALTVPADEVSAAIRHGARVVELDGDVQDNALIRDVQWDALGAQVLHLDLYRVEAGERVEATVAVELRGTAPGTREGGMVEHLLHEVVLDCPASSLPEKLVVNINDLQMGQAILAQQLPLPPGATLVTGEQEVVVQCVEPLAVPEVEEAAAGEEEPEVIGRRAEEEGEGEGS